MTVILGPVPCQGCRRPVRWNGFRWIDTLRGRQHVCIRCGAWMPLADERCARRRGHRGGKGGGHRTAYALANAARARTGRAA